MNPTPADMPGAQPASATPATVAMGAPVMLALPPRTVAEALDAFAEDIDSMPPGVMRDNMKIAHGFIAAAAQHERRAGSNGGLSGHQQLRRVALDFAVRQWADTVCTPGEVLGTAIEWAHWVKTGYLKTDGEGTS